MTPRKTAEAEELRRGRNSPADKALGFLSFGAKARESTASCIILLFAQIYVLS